MQKHGNECEHVSRKSRCVICLGSEICTHKIRRSRCLQCHGSEICLHNHRRDKCSDCSSSKKTIANQKNAASKTGKNFKTVPSYFNDLTHRCEIRTSLVPNAGLGVFACVGIPAKRLIGYFSGRLIPNTTSHNTDYSIRIDDRVRNASGFPRGYSAMINDSYGTPYVHNIEFVRIKGKYKIALFTICYIERDEELYVDYGKEYWKDRERTLEDNAHKIYTSR